MGVTPDEFYQTLAGEADEEVKQRVLRAIEEKDPVVCDLIEARKQRALEWLKLTADPTTGDIPLLRIDSEDQAKWPEPEGPDDA